MNSSKNKSLPNLKKEYETRWLAASIVKRAARCQFHQDELTGQACLEQPIIPGVSRQENTPGKHLDKPTEKILEMVIVILLGKSTFIKEETVEIQGHLSRS